MIPESPFAPAHSRESFLETLPAREALERLEAGLGAREPFLLLTGEPGTGKTALVHEAMARWGSRVTAAFVAYPALGDGEMLEELVRRFGGEPPEGASRPRLLACLEGLLAGIAGRGQVAMIVVDDAHDLPAERLEELRLLVNAALHARGALEVLLVGLPALAARLAEPALDALGQRVSVRANVAALSVGETQRYLHHRVMAAGGDGPGLFSRRTCRDIAALANGVPRRINALATEALRLTRAADQPTVVTQHVQAAAVNLWGSAGAGVSPAAEAPALRPEVSGAEPVRRAPASAGKRPQVEPDEQRPAPPVKHDPKEWVARFVGERGPLQLSSRASAEAKWAPERVEAGVGGPAGAGGAVAGAAAGPSRRRTPVSLAPARSRRGGMPGVLIAASLGSIVVIGVVALLVRAGGIAHRGASRPQRSASAPAGPRRSAPGGPASASSGRPVPIRVAPGDAAPPQTAASAPASSEPSERGAPSPGSDGPSTQPASDMTGNSSRRYSIEVGGYLDLQRALEQRDLLRQRTGIVAWVVSVPEGGGEVHNILLGIFRSPERAASAANRMLANATLTEAKVVPLPPRRDRQ